MPNNLSIRERIERRIIAIVQAISGIGTVYRWDGRSLRDPSSGLGVNSSGEKIMLGHLDAVVFSDDESAAPGGLGNGGFTDKTLELSVQVNVQLAEDDTDSDAACVNRWALFLETALTADPRITASGVRLATDSRITRIENPPVTETQPETMVIVRMEANYTHYRNDPSTGPGITAVTEQLQVPVTVTGATWESDGAGGIEITYQFSGAVAAIASPAIFEAFNDNVDNIGTGWHTADSVAHTPGASTAIATFAIPPGDSGLISGEPVFGWRIETATGVTITNGSLTVPVEGIAYSP